MNAVKIRVAYEQVPVSSERTFPAAPFPQTYVHCVIDDLRDAVLSVLALRTAGYPPSAIHVMARWDCVEAVERRHQQHTLLSRRLMCFWSFLEEGLGDVYLHKVRRGHHLLVVRLGSTTADIGYCLPRAIDV